MTSTDEQEVCRQRNLLLKFRKAIIADLVVHDVIPELLQNFVISHSDKQRIDHEKSAEDKADKLLTVLEERASKTLNADIIPFFIKSLQQKYEWLYKLLTEDVPDSIPSSTGFENGFKNLSLYDRSASPEVFKDRPLLSSTGVTGGRKVKALLESGGVPCLPTVAVERNEVLKDIRDELEILKRNQYLVICGMAGSGKTVLAIQAVSDEKLVSANFQDGVYWLAIGKECSESKDALLAKMRILCDKLGESKAPNSIEHGVDILRTAFMKRTDCLLVLDDVWRAEVIRYFDLGCRTLVTTRDLAVMDVVNGRVKYFKIEEGFSKEESLRLFAQALQIKDSQSLPKEAYEIHCECKGSPMVISLISSLMQEHRDVSDSGRWEYYLESLTRRKYSKMRKARSYEHESIVDAISLSIESLSDKYREYYSDFALFQDDVGIPTAVLMTLWGVQRYEVEDIMKDFVRKSMAMEEYDSAKKTYVYTIHDLQLDYLKYQLLSDSKCEKDLHQRLLERYEDSCNKEFHKLPDDGYIYFYLGYHIYKSGAHHLFPTVYLDLQFIGEKIRVTGPADLLVDIKKYLDFIVCDKEEKLKLVEEIQTFAQLEGHKIYGQRDVDIIQIALQAPYLRRVQEQARSLARASPNRLYIEWTNSKSGQWKHPESTVLCSDHVLCAKFVGSGGNYFIAGLHNGTIQFCDLESSAVCHIFFGHMDAVNTLQIISSKTPVKKNGLLQNGSAAHLVFLSASADKTCKMWDLQPVIDEVELLSTELKSGRLLGTSPSPKLRPDHWSFEHRRDDSYFTFQFHTASVTSAEFAIDGSRVISTSLNEILVWDSSNGSVIFKISPYFEAFPDLTYQLCRVPPEKYPSYLICSAENQLVLLSPQRSTAYGCVEGHTMRIVDLIFLSSDRFCSVSENDIGLWKVVKNFPTTKTFRSRSLSPSRIIPPTMINGKLALPKQGNSNLLQPLDMNQLMPGAVISTESGGKSPGSKSDCYTASSLISVQIEDGNVSITAIRENVLPKKGAGNYLCAALVKNDDKYLLACGTSDHKIVLWELSVGKFLGNFTSHNGWVTCLDFSTVDVCTLLSGSEDHCVMVWDIEEEERGTKEPTKHPKFTSNFHESGPHKGHFLSTFISEKNTVQVYRDSKRLFETTQFEFEVTAVILSPCSSSSTFAAVGTSIGEVWRVLIPAHFSTSVSGAPEKKVDLDVKLIACQNNRITLFQLDSTGQFLISGASDGSFMVFMNFMLINRVQISTRPICGVHFPFHCSIFVACSQDGKVQMFDAVEPRNFQRLSIPGDPYITCTEVTQDGTQLALGTTESGIILFHLDKEVGMLAYKILNCHHKSPVRSLAFDAYGQKLAVGHDNGLVTIWKIEGDSFHEERDLVLHKSWVRKMKFSPMHITNSKWLITCGDKLVFWSLEKPEEKQRRTSFMSERRRRRSGESPSKSNRLSLEIPSGSKIGRQGKRELLQQFCFRGNYAMNFENDGQFSKVIAVDDTGVFYLLENMK